MGKMIARIKIMPTDIDTNLDDLAYSISRSMTVKRYSKEPIAFGINALVIDLVVDEENTDTDALENTLKGYNGVSEVQIVNMSRESARL
jgi:elongation factor 1-beta